MRTSIVFLAFAITIAASLTAAAQAPVVVVDPTKPAAETKLGGPDREAFDRAIPNVRARLKSETCVEEVEVAGVQHGAFTRAGADETLVFYQYCQTGNGLGWVGLVLIEGGKVTKSFVSDTGWSIALARLDDIDGSGVDEFALSYGGGMHQGEGGVGVDIMQFANGRPRGIGWFQAEKFMDAEPTTVWRVTAKKGSKPVFYKQKYTGGEGKWRRVGGDQIFKLGEAIAKFETVK